MNNFDKVLEMEWGDLALGVTGSAVVMLAINYFMLM